MRAWLSLLTILAGGATLLGCGPDAGAPLHRHSDRRYALEVAPTASGLELRVTPRGRWEIATAYPTELRCAGRVQQARDASRLDADGLVFEIGADRSPDGEVDATARFGVCVGPRCEPVEHRFGIPGYAARR